MSFIRRKYGNKKVEHAGRTFDSKLETGLFDLLSLKERAGSIRNLKHQPGSVFLSKARIQYRPDFSWESCETDIQEWGESKGFETPEWRIKRKLWGAYGPGKLFIWIGSAAHLTLKEVLIPGAGD